MDDRHTSDEFGRLIDRCCDQAGRVDARSALAGGALGLLLSSRHGRGLLGKALKYGVVAGLGALAWQTRRQRSGYDADEAREMTRPPAARPGDGEPSEAGDAPRDAGASGEAPRAPGFPGP
ncbi:MULTISPECIES: DUF533 domain-containing protein [unclassified Modicisalibacter]|uniref:DUF533 domain-containing protein n=1 Tax=unclassified Modicisalibacter TaxID=2679913 RepID=UPI001CCA4633|nr:MULTISPECIES: DUF533 domain-containing protein [unclassified Modicisalibacter]MBZ9560349.1 DUF533 domain-containing protein [Modicisalibacter sp. R2A 31.J]MBZ9576258.1 DUF533 domain-containing protein [Modicisalibacter sp. MOD 31.J]